MNYRKRYFYGHTGDKNAFGFPFFLMLRALTDRDREQQQHIIMDCQAFVNTNVDDLNVIIATELENQETIIQIYCTVCPL